MRTGRPLSPISVTQEQRSALENWKRRPKTFTLSKDPLFIEKVRDIVGLYLTGAVISECYRRHRSTEFRKFLDTIDQSVPPSLEST